MSTTRKLEPSEENTSSTIRRCIEPGCRTPLSLYNSSKRCWYHQSKARRAVIGMSATLNALPVWSPPLLFPAPKPRAVLQKQLALTAPVATTSLEEVVYKPPGEKILEVGCEYFLQSKKEMTGPRRNRTLSLPRQVIMYLLKHDTKLSTVAIGRMFNRDHSTVVHAVSKIDYLLKTNIRLQHEIASIRSLYQKPPS